MKFCRSCKNINFTKSTVHTFKDVGLDPGCAMCGYIFRLMGYSPVDNLDGQRIYLWEPDEHLELRLNRRTKSVRVQIKGSSDVKLRLRLCATYGKERTAGVWNCVLIWCRCGEVPQCRCRRCEGRLAWTADFGSC